MRTVSGHLLERPGTKLGRWSVGLEATFVVMFLLDIVLVTRIFDANPASRPLFVVFVVAMLVAGLAGGICGVMAVIRQHERTILVWLAIGLGLFVFLMVVNELEQALTYFLGA